MCILLNGIWISASLLHVATNSTVRLNVIGASMSELHTSALHDVCVSMSVCLRLIERMDMYISNLHMCYKAL